MKGRHHRLVEIGTQDTLVPYIPLISLIIPNYPLLLRKLYSLEFCLQRLKVRNTRIHLVEVRDDTGQ